MSNAQASIEKVSQTVEDSMKEILRVCNFMGSDDDVAKGMLEAINKEHRTIQQSFFRALNQMIVQYAEQEFADGRNQASVDYCKQVTQLNATFPII